MICQACGGALHSIGIIRLKTGELKRRYRCIACTHIYSAYSSNDGETWRFENRPSGRPMVALTMETQCN